MKICYRDQYFKKSSLVLLEKANKIIEEHHADGFDLSLRQLYYQLVSRNLIPNNLQSYKTLVNLITNARMAGLVDWDDIEDRGRFLRVYKSWEDEKERLEDAAGDFITDRWANQEHRPEVWVEKDALIQVAEKACGPWHVPFYSCRGYNSASGMHEAAKRLIGHLQAGQTPVVIHLGDHDPSGRDMTRDILDRMEIFFGFHGLETPDVRRIALNIGQVRKYKLPPNPAKPKDERYKKYVAEFGTSCWELDAMEPKVIAALIDTEIRKLVDKDEWDADGKSEGIMRSRLHKTATHWTAVKKLLARKK